MPLRRQRSSQHLRQRGLHGKPRHGTGLPLKLQSGSGPLPSQGNNRHGKLYTGVTSNLPARIWQHREGAVRGFTRHYGIKRLVWFELHEEMDSAILREKRIKRWPRSWKYDLIHADNPTWRDLAEDFGFQPLPLK